jgi:hypothetical protein
VLAHRLWQENDLDLPNLATPPISISASSSIAIVTFPVTKGIFTKAYVQETADMMKSLVRKVEGKLYGFETDDDDFLPF